jgi:hypothetical protein
VGQKPNHFGSDGKRTARCDPGRLYVQHSESLHQQKKFGFNEMPSIPNDGNRTRLQQQMMNYRMPGTNEPVIVRKTPNGYELLEALAPDNEHVVERGHRRIK